MFQWQRSGGSIHHACMHKVYTFDMPVDDMKRAKTFYEKVFSWKIAPIPGSGGNYHSAITVPSDERGEPKFSGGINGGFYQRGTHGLTGTFIEINVPSIDKCLKKVEEAGGTMHACKDSPIKWKCRNCGYVFEGREAPDKCPVCDHARSYFEVWCENY